MTETKGERQKRELKELEGKNIAFYSVMLGAWIQSRMERDKTLVTLSAAAIGLLVTILTTVGIKIVWEIPLYIIAVTSFSITIWTSLVIYQLNSKHLEEALRGSSEKDPSLEKYDKRSIKSFIFGSIAALAIGILSASYQLNKPEENSMSDKDESSKSTVKPVRVLESVDGVKNLNPKTIIKKSLDGITDLNPQATQKPTEPSAQTPAKTQGDTSTQGDSGNSSPGSEKE